MTADEPSGGSDAGEKHAGRGLEAERGGSSTGRPTVEGVHVLDLEHVGVSGAICTYLLDTSEPVLVDPGPATTLPTLKEKLAELGMEPSDLRHLLLTHVHLDHAGAAGHLARNSPRLSVHVHQDGAPHMADPERLVASTRRSFGDDHDRLWGDVLPVPEDQLRAWRPGDPRPLSGWRPLPTPGHIGHHLAWEEERVGVLFGGDSLGIVLEPSAPSHPATPPPAVDLTAWRETLQRALAPVEVDAFAATHFGLHGGLHRRRHELLEALRTLTRRVRGAMEEGPDAAEADREAFQRETVETQGRFLAPDRATAYFSTFSARADWDGIRFRLERRPEDAGVLLAR
ncbi:MAG: MBL fold metallo-hydrolase [bacterium]